MLSGVSRPIYIATEPAEVRYRQRQRDSVPLLDALFDLCREYQNDATILPKSPLAKACAYALNNGFCSKIHG